MNMMSPDINLSKEAPQEEPLRQYYYIEKAKQYVEEEAKNLGRSLTFCVTTFGCQMNARDSEKLRGILNQIGYEEAEENEADFVIYNTCTVRENANTRVYGRLGQLKPRKKQQPHMMIGLCGCMMQEPEVIAKLKRPAPQRRLKPNVVICFSTSPHKEYAHAESTRIFKVSPIQIISDKTFENSA